MTRHRGHRHLTWLENKGRGGEGEGRGERRGERRGRGGGRGGGGVNAQDTENIQYAVITAIESMTIKACTISASYPGPRQ